MKTSAEILELAYDQMLKDRETILASYNQFSGQVVDLQEYAVSGQNLNKCLELLTKQTAQLLELAKMRKSVIREDELSFSADDESEIYDKIDEPKANIMKLPNGRK